MIPLACKFLVAFHRKDFEWMLLDRVAFTDKGRRVEIREKRMLQIDTKGLRAPGILLGSLCIFINMMLASRFHAVHELMQSLWYVLPSSSAEKQTEVATSNESTTPCWNDSKQWINYPARASLNLWLLCHMNSCPKNETSVCFHCWCNQN